MAEKRYYWLKLKEDFFRQKAMKKLRSMERGETYVIVYLKMQLESLRRNGILEFDGLEDSFADELALQIDESISDVNATVGFLTKHGLLVQLTETESFLPEAVGAVGSEGSSAKRMRELRERGASQCDGDAVTSLRREKRKEIENRDREKSESKPADKPPARPRFTPPTLEEVVTYCQERGSSVDPEHFISYYQANGWRVGRNPMRNWRAAVQNWERRDKENGYKRDCPDHRPADDERDWTAGFHPADD